MHRSRLVLAVSAVLFGTALILVIAGVQTNLLLIVLALPIAASAAVLWADATDRLPMVVGVRRPDRRSNSRNRRRRESPEQHRQPPTSMAERRARRVLGVGPEADDAAIRQAFRERAKDVHPDADNGSEAAFKRLTDAYDRLRE